ncbi:MAG: hypothetical protein ACXVCL_15805 [Bdellovibrio sp.]
MTTLDNAESGLAVVQVKGAMWGSGLLALIKNEETKEGNPGEFELAVITPSHLIQNSLNPTVLMTPRFGNFLTGSIRDPKSSVPQLIELRSKEIQASVKFQDALRDIALLKLNLSIDDPLYLSLFDIARKNLVLCEDEDAHSSCFHLKDFYSAVRTRMVFNEKINWILNGKIVNQPLSKENEEPSVSVVDDQYISGLYKKIFALSVYGGPGMSGGGFYLNDRLAGMVSKVHYDGFPEVYAIPMNEIYETLTCFYWKSEDCEKDKLSSSWVTEGNQQFLTVNYKGVQLKQIVAPIPLGFAGSPISLRNGPGVVGSGGGPGVVGSGGGPGVVGSGGGATNPYIYIHHLPGAELMESTGTPLVNPFTLSENNFVLNKERYCSLQLSGSQLNPSPNIPRFILTNRDINGTQAKSCFENENSKKGTKYSPPKRARYFFHNQELTNANSLHYDFMESGFNSYTLLSSEPAIKKESINGFSSAEPAFLKKAQFTYNNEGCLNTFPIALCRTSNQNSNAIFKAQIRYKLNIKDSYTREIMEVELNENLDSITLKKFSAKTELEKSATLKKQKTTSGSISYANENKTTRAVLNFSDQDQGQPFNLFIQTPKLLLQFEW